MPKGCGLALHPALAMTVATTARCVEPQMHLQNSLLDPVRPLRGPSSTTERARRHGAARRLQSTTPPAFREEPARDCLSVQPTLLHPSLTSTRRLRLRRVALIQAIPPLLHQDHPARRRHNVIVRVSPRCKRAPAVSAMSISQAAMRPPDRHCSSSASPRRSGRIFRPRWRSCGTSSW